MVGKGREGRGGAACGVGEWNEQSFKASDDGRPSESLQIVVNTLCVAHSVVMFFFVSDRKFRLPIGLQCTVAAVSAKQPVEHVKNITT